MAEPDVRLWFNITKDIVERLYIEQDTIQNSNDR